MDDLLFHNSLGCKLSIISKEPIGSAALLGYKSVHVEGNTKIIIDSINDSSLNLGWEFQAAIAAIRSYFPCFTDAFVLGPKSYYWFGSKFSPLGFFL